MNLTRKQKALYSAGVLWLLFFGGLIFLSPIVDVLLGVIYLIGWVLVLRFTNPRVAHLPPADRFGIGTDERPSPPRPAAPRGPVGPGPVGDDLPAVVVPDDPEEQARLAAARAEREAERAEAKQRRGAGPAGAEGRKRGQRGGGEGAPPEGHGGQTQEE